MLRLVQGLALAVASLAAGSWVGLGKPDAATTARYVARAERAMPSAVMERTESATIAPGPPADPPVPQIDAASLPNPTPFPQLNPEESTHRAWLVAEGPAHAPKDGRRIVTLTFDDGPFPETTPPILDLLARYHVRATFFWIGRYLDGEDDRAVTTRAVARRVVEAGHFIGNHTHDHLVLTSLPRAQVLAQIDEGAASIERVTGRRPMLFRPPYGALDAYGAEALRARGEQTILWSIEADDNRRHDSAAMATSLRRQIEYAGGGIVLLHDIRLTTIPVLASLLEWLRAHRWDPQHPSRVGYEVVDLAEYLRETERTPQPYSDRQELELARARAWHRDRPRAEAPPPHGSSEGRALAF